MKYILFQLKNMVIKIRTGMVFVQADLLSLNWPVGFTMFFDRCFGVVWSTSRGQDGQGGMVVRAKLFEWLN